MQCMRAVDANSAPRSRGDFVASLAAGLRVLAAFTADHPELGVGELVRMLEMDKRRTQRLVSTLFDLGYLEQDPQTRRYRPGVSALTLGYAALQSLDLRQLARPHLVALIQRFGQSVNLAVRHRAEVMFIDCLRGATYRLGVNVHIGDRLPIQLSSLGKALLAYLPEQERADIIGEVQFQTPTEYAAASPAELLEMLAQTRERGFAAMDQETTLGVRSVAAPLMTPDGYPVAAVNVVMPTPLVSMAEMTQTVAPALVETAARISRLLPAGVDSRHETGPTGAELLG